MPGIQGVLSGYSHSTQVFADYLTNQFLWGALIIGFHTNKAHSAVLTEMYRISLTINVNKDIMNNKAATNNLFNQHKHS